MAEESWEQKLEAAGHLAQCGAQLAFCFYSVWDHSPEDGATHIQNGLILGQLNLATPYRHAQRFMFMATLSPDILTFKINHQMWQGINYMIIN